MKNKSTSAPTVSAAATTPVWYGMNWISQHKRLAIYLRDGLACAYCGAGVETGIKLALDHIVPRSQPGSTHKATNLITCCMKCNTARGDRDVSVFAARVAERIGGEAQEIIGRVERQRTAPLDTETARRMMGARTCKAVLETYTEGA